MRSFEVSNSSAGKAGSRRISPQQLERLRQRVALGFDREGQLPRGTGTPAATATAATAAAAAATRSDADAQRIELLAQRLAIVLLRAGHHQAGQHPGRRRLALERFFVAVVQGQHERHRLAAVLLRQQAGLQATVVTTLIRASRFAGEGSKASPAVATLPPL